MSDHAELNREPSSAAPTVEPPRLELLPYAGAEQSKRAGLAGTILWGSALAAALALAAGVAAFGVYDHTKQANLVAAKTEETLSLAETVKGLAKRLDAIDAARARDEAADMRKVSAEMKTEGAAGRELGAQLAQANARLDKLDHDHGARLDKLTDRLDHESAGKFADLSARLDKFADLSARLDKLEKRPVPVAAVVAPAPAKPAAAQVAQPVSDETTGAIERPRLRGYWLVEAQDGYAVIDGRDGPQQVTPGDVLPGVGRVQRIERRGGDWAVVTSAGIIAGDQPPF
ncbi:MAG: hypothetical protein E7774_07365 [Bradyrhizobium sp.]|nr:MAG: hypothetical protein E7774_07365 [Bradyrhizobium sp.]